MRAHMDKAHARAHAHSRKKEKILLIIQNIRFGEKMVHMRENALLRRAHWSGYTRPT